MQAFVKALIPDFIREEIHRQRYYFIFKRHFDRRLRETIGGSNYLTQELVDETMRQHGLNCLWAGMFTALNGIPSRDYVSNGFFFSQIQPRVNKPELIEAYADKNFYDLIPIGKFTPQAVLRKISGRFFDADYKLVGDDEIKNILDLQTCDLVIKPAIESGSGKDVWIGPPAEAYPELMGRVKMRDIIVQQCLVGDEFSRRLNPTSFNTIRIVTAFTGSKYVVLGGALRMGFQGARVDNMTAGGLLVGIREDGSLCDFAIDKNFNKFETHPHIPLVFRDEKVPGYDRVYKTSLELHQYLPHFGIISWDIAIDADGKVRVIEYNLDWQGVNVNQIAHGPLFGIYKDEFKKTYDLPDWEQ